MQLDSDRVCILLLMLLAGHDPRSIIDTIAKMCSNAELRSLRDIKQDLSKAQEQGMVESVRKSLCRLACLLH